jgi:hypothetical protein
MPSHRLLVLSCCVAALTACSGSSAKPAAAPSPTPSPIESLDLTFTAAPTPSGGLPIASAYQVLPQKGLTYADLTAAYDKIAKIPGLRALQISRSQGLRVDLAVPDDPKQREAVLAVLKPLGVVRVAF